MQLKISETTALGGFGAPSGKKLFKVNSGPYTGRLVTILKSTDSSIEFSFSSSPQNSWNSFQTIVSDASLAPFDAVMLHTGDIYLTYCETSTDYLVLIKLSITNDGWSVGNKYYIYNNGITNTPTITTDNNDTLYVCFSYYNGSTFSLHVKSSSDDGVTWGTGSADLGDTIQSGLNVGLPKIMLSASKLYVLYAADWLDIKVTEKLLSGDSWSAPFTVASGLQIDEHFDALVLPDGFLGVVYDSDQLNYREYDGTNWSPVMTIDSQEGFFPQLTLVNNIPVILYLSTFTTGQVQLKQSNHIEGTFSAPQTLSLKSTAFSSLLLYDNGTSSYEDKTTAAQNASDADVYHSQSSALMENQFDKMYIGSDDNFRFLNILLSTPGVGGMVTYSYFDGANWKSFLPASGAFQFDSTEKALMLWTDNKTIPLDWQKTIINGTNLFWIKIEVISGYAVAPVGSRLTSISNLSAITVRR